MKVNKSSGTLMPSPSKELPIFVWCYFSRNGTFSNTAMTDWNLAGICVDSRCSFSYLNGRQQFKSRHWAYILGHWTVLKIFSCEKWTQGITWEPNTWICITERGCAVLIGIIWLRDDATTSWFSIVITFVILKDKVFYQLKNYYFLKMRSSKCR